MKHNLLETLDRKSLSLVREIGVLADEAGMRAYLVGGPVRDLALKHPSLDLDVVIEGAGMRLATAFAAKHDGAKVTRYPAFQTATVTLSDGRLVDFATARKETYARPGAFPQVTAAKIKDDLFRRDFTVNAMAIALDPAREGELVDPFSGMKDLADKKVRILHNKSFTDDPTRILRAARFAARLKFDLEPKTLKTLHAAINAKALDSITPQRYLKEFKKIIKEPNSAAAGKYLASWGALKYQGD